MVNSPWIDLQNWPRCRARTRRTHARPLDFASHGLDRSPFRSAALGYFKVMLIRLPADQRLVSINALSFCKGMNRANPQTDCSAFGITCRLNRRPIPSRFSNHGDKQPPTRAAVFRLVVAFILVCQAAFRKLCCSCVGFGVFGLRWTSLIGLQLRAAPDQRLGFA